MIPVPDDKEHVVLKALIVEDNRMFREVLKGALISFFPSMEIKEEADGREVMDKVKEQEPDVVFMDIQLPHDNGLNLTLRIKNLSAHIPVIIITEHDLPDYRNAAFQAGADFFFSKAELKPGDIVHAVESIMNVRQT
jgi:DNA-binding NarL/FixJ family response regulator